MKIQKVRFFNFRNVPNIEKELNGSNIILLAENTKGKSNFIKGIQAALAGNVGPDAITNGQKEAKVDLVLSDFNEKGERIPGTDYLFCMRAYLDKHGEQKVNLEVTAPNGFRETKKTIIGTIAGEVELDFNFVELSRTKAGKAKQVEIVRSYLDEETKQNLRMHENKIKNHYDDRTELGREIKILESKVIGMSDEDVLKYANQIDIKAVQEKLTKAVDHNTKVNTAKQKAAGFITTIEENTIEIASLEAQIKKIKDENKSLEAKSKEAENWFSVNPIIDIADLQNEISEANYHNVESRRVSDYKKSMEELEEKRNTYGEFTAFIDSTRQAIKDAIKDMDHPIKGISFDEENVYYNGKLVDESCLSTSEIMMLEVEFKMCKMPKAEVVFIQRGESLGLEMLAELQKTAKERGYQLIMEQVERGTEELKIEFMPDFVKKQLA